MKRDVPAEALGVLRVFFAAAGKGDADTMRFCLTKESVEEPGWDQWPRGTGFEIEQVGWESTGEHEGEAVVVIVRVVTGTKGKAREDEGRMVCYLVKEEGAWKFDLRRSMEVMFGGSGKSRAEMITELARAMEGVTGNLGGIMKGMFDVQEENEQEEEEEDEDEDKDNKERARAEEEKARAKELNDENFAAAVKGLKQMEPTWAMQMEMAAGHRVNLELDFDSLGGIYARVQPFIHQAMAAVVGAFPMMMMDRDAYAGFLQQVKKVKVHGAEAGGKFAARFDNGILDVTVPLQDRDMQPPVQRVLNAIRKVLALAPLPVIEEPAPAEEAAAMEDDDREVDPYAAARKFIKELEKEMKHAKIWPGKKPRGKIEVKGAFGSENMAFNQWLAWVLIARVKEIVKKRGEFPSQSQVAAYAVREWDGQDYGEVVKVLREFDEMVNGIESSDA